MSERFMNFVLSFCGMCSDESAPGHPVTPIAVCDPGSGPEQCDEFETAPARVAEAPQGPGMRPA